MGYPRRRLSVCAARIALLAAAFVLSVIPALSVPKTASAEPGLYGAVTLMWTTPGDDGRIGRATKYDLRISTRSISSNDTLTWWNQATVINMANRIPLAAGVRDSIILGGLLTSTRYYAILRVGDEKPNWSGFSNMASFVPGTITGIDGADVNAPAFVVKSPRPSPTTGRTQIDFELPHAMHVEAQVYDAMGRLVRTLENGMLGGGSHVLRWDGGTERGGNAASGVYWVSVIAGSIRKKVKLIVIH
jgi:hypothetical protein